MKRLLVLRHAKAGPHDEKNDKERALIERGRGDAARMGRAMREKGYLPSLVLCSSAKRTAETWENASSELGANAEVKFLDSLYDASEATILNCVRAVKQDVPVVLFIGHNPGLERFARMLSRKPSDSRERERAVSMAQKFPTSALAVLDFDTEEWAKIALASAALSDFLTPASVRPN